MHRVDLVYHTRLAVNPRIPEFSIKLEKCLWHLKELHKPEKSFTKTGSRSGAATDEENVKPADQHEPPSGLYITLQYWPLVVTY